MSSHKNLHFFNKQGDSLNINYNENTELFEGNILFDENSTDTFKTYALYTLEKVPTFEFESVGELGTNKFQLFNEFGFHFYGSNTNKQEKIVNIEPVNNDPSFYSKWIYGEDFEVKFPIGSLVVFNNTILEFTNTNQAFVVVGSKKGAIMIISTVDNSSFELIYQSVYTDSSLYTNKYISSVDAIGINNYINTNYENKISQWSEPNFYDKLYEGKKLNVVNSDLNDGVYTVENTDIADIIHFDYSVNKLNLPINSDLIIEVLVGTDLPKIYEGGMDISSNGKIYLSDYFNYPRILKPGQVFKIVGSSNNENFLTVSDIPDFSSVNNITNYIVGDQVIYNGVLYECIESYTHNHALPDTLYIRPDNDTIHWSNPTHIKVNESTNTDSLLHAQLYLTTDRYYYTQEGGLDSSITMATMADRYSDEFKQFNIDLYYKKNYLRADLTYPSRYATVNFYHTEISPGNIIGGETRTFERLISTKEIINTEINDDYSERYKYNLVFTDIDEFGIKVIINKMVYEEEVAFVYSGGNIDMERTIDKTLRNWLTRNFVSLHKLGINAELQYTGSYTSIFFNSILLVTEYPNVPIVINDIQVGTTANVYIEHSKVLFNDLGPFLDIRINDKSNIVQTVSVNGVVDIPSTLIEWSNLYSTNLLEFGIITNVKNNLLLFDIEQGDTRLDYTISSGKINLPGISDYVITKKLKGNDGVLIASNEVILSATSSSSFEEVGFATGMVFSINNTYYPYVNQEYSVEYLDPKVMNLSYQGPFWDVNNFICNSSPFVTIAFNLGFGQTGCGFNPLDGTGGHFNREMYNDVEFNMDFSTNTYLTYLYDGVSGMVDIKYIQLSNSVYVLGDTSIGVLDSHFGTSITTINIPPSQSIKLDFNVTNDYLYSLSNGHISVIDPVTNTLLFNITLVGYAFDMLINPENGDVYVTYVDSNKIDIFYSNNSTSIPNVTINTSYTTGKMVFNDFEGDVYITTTGDTVLRIDGSTRTLQTSYPITGLLPYIFYEPVNESIIVYGSVVHKIDNGVVTTTNIPTATFTDVIFNNLTGDLNISDSSNNFSRSDLNGNITDFIDVSHYGYLGLNPFDGSVYISSQNNGIVIIDPLTNVFVTKVQTSKTTKLTYNPDRKSMWFIQPLTNKIIEIDVELNNTISVNNVTSTLIEDNLYGTLSPTYVPRPDIWLKSRDYFRKPRENFEGDVSVKYYWKWFADNVPQFFMYDFSGEQLKLSSNIYKGSTSYEYIGETPLSTVILNREPNIDTSKVSLSEFQKTIFDRIEYTLSYIDDESDISTDTEPFQLFLGFQSQTEGALRSILQLYKHEDIRFKILSDSTQYITMETINDEGDRRGVISLSKTSNEVFTDRGLKVGQHISIYVKDTSNSLNQYISHNNGSMFIIREIYTKTLILDFFNVNTDILENESTLITGHPTTNDTTYLSFELKVVDKEIGRFFTYGQTEEEDVRFKIELGNVGKLINPDDVFIFKQYDILEGGIDWTFLNKKRKEMMMMKHLIYPYIGSYKSIINAINFFGYNDLQLNEYYRNVDTGSANFSKLFKVEIPDIFDNTVEGWTENDFIKNTMPNDNFEGTNMFNLTYFITDRDGTNVLTYSLDEVIIKLQGLKYWLKKNIIPLTHNILDITGRTFFNTGNHIQHRVSDVRIININDNMTPVTFKLNEAYLMPINSGSTVYNCVLDFYSIIPGIGADKNPTGLVEPPTVFNNSITTPPDYFNVKIRTYKTYKEWSPFKVYSIGDKITYLGKLYESVIDNNRVNNPKKYELVAPWSPNESYVLTSIVEYNRDIYTLSHLELGLSATQSSINPFVDRSNIENINSSITNEDDLVVQNWLDITEWREIDFEPVQTINEFRNGENLLPFNFTIDSNIDPFIVVEVISDNGYGCVYNDKKNYEIRGIRDLTEPRVSIEPIGPFIPITIV